MKMNVVYFIKLNKQIIFKASATFFEFRAGLPDDFLAKGQIFSKKGPDSRFWGQIPRNCTKIGIILYNFLQFS